MKKIAFFSIILISVFIINNLIHSIYSLWQKQDLLISAQKQLDKERKENQTLKNQLRQVNNPAFIEEEARDKLLMLKPGERVVVLPQPTATPTPDVSQKSTKQKPNWQQWLELFF